MLKLIIVMVMTVFLAEASLTNLTIEELEVKLQGAWTPVKIFPRAVVRQDASCYSSSQNLTGDVCQCDRWTAPILRRSNWLITNTLPIIIVEDDQELKEAFNATCICEEVEAPTFMVMRYVSDNYLMFYDKGYDDREKGKMAVLIAKERPLTADLEAVIAKTNFLREEGTILCTKDFKVPARASPYDDILADFYMKLANIRKQYHSGQV